MKLAVNQQAPPFTVTDVNGVSMDLRKLHGEKLFLVFQRNAGCPVCNLRTHQLLSEADFFQSHGTVVVLVYESAVQKMKEYLDDKVYPFHFIADPKNELYDRYGVERSFVKLLKGMFSGLPGKVMAGKKFFDKSISQDGNMDRVPAEFLIDKQGQIQYVHYNNYLGDDIPMWKLKELIGIPR